MNTETLKQTMQRVIASGPFAENWESLKGYAVPTWYEDGKFGIFIHWGPYSVPAFDNEWFPRNMYLKDSVAYKHHLETYGSQTTSGYKDFLPRFKAQHFDPNAWATLFKQAGAKYVVPVAEHHDGFAMYNCSFTPWNAVTMGPQRDVLGELAAAIRHQGLTFGLSYQRAEHWWFLNGGRNIPSDVLAVNGEAIYGSRPWKVFGEGPTEVAGGSFTDAKQPDFTSQDIRFTMRGETLYATFLAWPENSSVVITSLAEKTGLYPAPIAKVELLGADQPLSWGRDETGLRVELPVDKPCEYAGVLKITA